MKEFFTDNTKIILLCLVAINLVSFAVYGIDKFKAKAQLWRIPESTLIILAAVGGSVGALLGMKAFHHKTRKPKFYIGVPAILIVQLALVAYICFI